jgi:pimeloyl-ACP methyl ester carboxylesterase
MDDVADIRQVVLFDLRGCGRSSRDLPDDAYQPDLCVEDIARLVEWLGSGPVDLLGFSYGGQLAMLLAEGHPHLIDRLILASTTAYPDTAKYLSQCEEYRRRAADVDPACTANWADDAIDDEEKTRRDAMFSAGMDLWNLDLVEDWRAVLADVRFSGCWNPNWLAGRLRSPRPADPGQVLRQLGRPTMILHGAHDLGFPVQVARDLHTAVPHSELAIINGAAHAAHFEKRTEWAARLRAFLTGNS